MIKYSPPCSNRPQWPFDVWVNEKRIAIIDDDGVFHLAKTATHDDIVSALEQVMRAIEGNL